MAVTTVDRQSDLGLGDNRLANNRTRIKKMGLTINYTFLLCGEKQPQDFITVPKISSANPLISEIQRAADSHPGFGHHMGVNLGGADIAMAKQVLHRADVRTQLE